MQPFDQVHDHWCAKIAIQTANLFLSRALRCSCRYIRKSAVVLVVRILKRYGAAYPMLILSQCTRCCTRCSTRPRCPRAAVDHALAQARLEQLCLCI